jgi:hypothetical protein
MLRRLSRPAGPASRRGRLSTGCTEGCGNVDYSTFANCGIFVFRTPCGVSEKAIHSLLRRARRGSRTKQHREVVRDGPQGPERKVDRSCGRNRDELGESLVRRRSVAPPISPLHYDRSDASAASSEHRPGSDRSPLGDRPCGVHLLRPHRGGCKCRDGDRDRARLVRRDLVLRAAARRGCAGQTPPAPLEPQGYAARRPGRLAPSANSSFRVSSTPISTSSRSRAVRPSGSRLSRCAERRRIPRCGRVWAKAVIPICLSGDLPL